MKATLKNYRQSPRKVRLVANLMKGKKISEALIMLKFVHKRAAKQFFKVVSSAVSNANNQGIDTDKLFIKNARVDKAATLKRFRPRARGSASRINKRSSHIIIELGELKNSKNK